MGQATIDQLIINSPYVEPQRHWKFNSTTQSFTLAAGRRPAGYVVATPGAKTTNDPGRFVEIPLVNQIRLRVEKWRTHPDMPYAGASGITRRLLEHWRNRDGEDSRFFFAQLEAIETLIWLVEAPDAEKTGIVVPSDGGLFQRLCSKMATGTGKTIVMAMVISWQILNKVASPHDKRFSRNVLVMAPGLTVKSRLQVLQPDAEGNYYAGFNLVPVDLRENMRQGRVLIRNWQALTWDSEEQVAKRRSVDKRGAKSDEAYVRHVLGEMANARSIVVINDEAHHAWRVPAGFKGASREDIEEATKWVGGLDRINQARGVLRCFDFSATPFAPSGKKSAEEALFGWIVSDFGLNDAIEAGLVKTPRIVVRDDGTLNKDYKSRFYHIYDDDEVKDDINRKADPQEPLPDLLVTAYYFLGLDWRETLRAWKAVGVRVPPVIITVANRTETAARIKHAFNHGKIDIAELHTPEKTLHIDSKVLEMAEAQGEASVAVPSGEEASNEDDGDDEPVRKLSKKEQAELLRLTVDTVGREGKPGEQIQNVISVGMLSEGWDAKTVTHIMGLRAFRSQLLCEQVVGRGLRRTAYDVNPETGLLEPEYVNIFGVPFSFMPHEGGEGTPPPPPVPKTMVEAVKEREHLYAISWPNIIRVDHVFKPTLRLDMESVKPLVLDASATPTLAELAPVIGGKPDVTKLSEIDLEKLARENRLQRIIFKATRDVFELMQPSWKGNKDYLLAQLFGIVEQFISSDRVSIVPPMFNQDELRRRLLLTLNMNKIVQHIWEALRFENAEAIVPVFDANAPIRSTSEMPTWYTGKPNEVTKRSHVNVCVFDSTWEASEAFELDRNPLVDAWVKNDHLSFEVLYIYRGVVRKYRPDFLIRLKNGTMLVLEIKGEDTEQDRTKRGFLDEWVKAVNAHGGFGTWRWAVSFNPKDLIQILGEAAETPIASGGLALA